MCRKSWRFFASSRLIFTKGEGGGVILGQILIGEYSGIFKKVPLARPIFVKMIPLATLIFHILYQECNSLPFFLHTKSNNFPPLSPLGQDASKHKSRALGPSWTIATSSHCPSKSEKLLGSWPE